MSKPKLISPMLDAFEMGGPISDHDGVRCCPAMRKNSDDKYIVKIISVPASQTKLDALLLTGAYPDKNAALAYFNDLANGIADEKKILDNLARLEGFVAFEDCQIVEMDDATGYDVYLLSEYRMTLERLIAKAPLTQLAAVNLGLDLCAGLSVCRRSGYLCVDLKPSNVYVVGDKEYKIGDLGFVRLNSLKYESLPDKYRSSYTAPELEDPFAYLNETMDIYAAGLILYQVFNGGTLPFSGIQAPAEKFAPPAYADAEMTEIILKACDPDPAERWQDPVQMGQAIVSYMQKNGANETPLAAEEPAEDAIETVADEVSEAAEPEIPEVEAIVETPEESFDEETIPETSEEDISDAVSLEDVQHAAVAEEAEEIPLSDVTECNAATEDADAPSEQVNDEPETSVEETAKEDAEASDEDISDNAENIPDPEELDNLSFLDDITHDESILSNVGDDYEGVTDEVSEILGQVDELAMLQVPDPVVAPEPIEIKIPEPVTAPEAEEAPLQDNSEDSQQDGDVLSAETDAQETDAVSESDTDVAAEDIPEEEKPYVPKKKRTGLVWTIIIILLLALGVGGYFFYTQYYQQEIYSLDLSGSEDTLQVQLSADVDESLLTVICADPHGDKVSAPVVGGLAVFSGLSPDTAYTVTVEIDGFHELTGVTNKVYSTPVQTKLSQLSAITGSEDGSVILSFTVEGPDSEQWNVIYNAEGEAERVTAFPSHVVTLAGLTVGKEYTFRLEPADDVYISGETELIYTVKNVVCAENLHITEFMNQSLTAKWDMPDGENVAQWTVRCYNEAGYDETIVTEELFAKFENIDETLAHTVEVTAAEMSVSQRVPVGANSVTVSDFSVDTSAQDVLKLSWKANRDVPAAGWSIRYSINDVNAAETVTTMENAAQIPAVPNGEYVFTILDEAGNAVLGGPFTHKQSEAAAFDAFGAKQSNITMRLCKTPAASSWSYKDLKDEDYVNTFAAGENISVVLALSAAAENADDNVLITYAIYDENGDLVTFSHDTQIWKTMWYQNYCELDVPAVSAEVGTYNLIVYFNAMEIGSQKFEITA